MDSRALKFSGLGLTFLALLLLNEEIGMESSLAKLTKDYSAILFLISFIFITILIYDFLEHITSHFRDKIYEKLHFRDFSQKVRTLGANEKYLLSLFIESKKMTCPLDPNDTSVNFLESSKIIFRTPEKKDDRFYMYRISPIAVSILRKNPNWLR